MALHGIGLMPSCRSRAYMCMWPCMHTHRHMCVWPCMGGSRGGAFCRSRAHMPTHMHACTSTHMHACVCTVQVEYGIESDLYRMLRQAMISRRALILIDGIDEGGTVREQVERHVVKVLAPQVRVVSFPLPPRYPLPYYPLSNRDTHAHVPRATC